MNFKSLVAISMVASALVAGTIANPTPIKNGINYDIADDNTQNYYTFTLSEDASVMFTASNDEIRVYFYDTDYNDYSTSGCYSSEDGNSFNCGFKKGTYKIQVQPYYSNPKQFSLFSTKMSDYIAPECSSESLSTNYTQSDIDTAVANAKSECKSNPSSCGIETTTNETITSSQELNSDYISNLELGWHLLGSSQSISNFGIFQSTQTVWFYENSAWQNYNPSSTTPPSLVPKNFQGFWIKK